MLDFDIQDHKPLREIVYEELRIQILTGKIKPGTRMMEIELAEDMGVSRTPIREAIRKLEKEGLVIIEPRKGAYASDVSIDDMVDILEIRGNLEGLAAYYASSRITEKEEVELKNASENFNKAVIAGDFQGMIENDTKFHQVIVEASRNKHLESMVRQLQELVLRFRYIYYKDFKRAEKMPAEHKRIYEGIINSDGETARNAAVVHIERLKEMIIQDINNDET